MADDQQKTKDTEAVEEKDIQTDEESGKAEEAATADENGKAVDADVEEAEEVENEAASEAPATDDESAADTASDDDTSDEDTSGSPDETADAEEEAAAVEAASASSDEDSNDAETKSEADDEDPETAVEADAAGDAVDEGDSDGESVATDEEKDARPLLERAVDAAAAEMAVPRAEDAGVSIQEEAPLSSVSGAEGLQATGQVGYTGEIVGRVVTLEELERGDEEDEKAAATYDQLMKLVDESFTIVEEQEIVRGRVVSVGEKDVVIDIGFKSDGVVSLNEFDRELEAGDEVEVFVDRLEDYHGQLVLSKTKADKLRRWQRIEEAYDQSSIIEGTIVRRIKGGMIVELDIGGMEAFLPGSQIDVRPVRDFDAYLEKRMEFKIVKLNPANENIVVSHKALIEKELEAQREKILSTMEAGQILEGIVKNITDFGVFIDLGGVDGLLHITDLSWGRVSHPSELVDLDEKLNVVVLDYDKERQRISLGLKQLQPHPWEDINEKYDEGETVEGKVVSITDYGAFVELEKGIEGLVHISEMSWTEHIRHPSQMVSLGQLVKVKILNIDKEGKKISLGMKQLEPDPWTGISDRYPPGTVMRGKVRNITNFGVFVEIEPGIDGLVHISDLSWTKKIRHPSEMIKKGQDLDVVILNVDEEARRISLGHKQVETNPWNQFAKVYGEGTDTEATVVRSNEGGLVVELPLEVEAFVPASELKNGPQNFQEFYQEGQEIELRVIKFDPNQKEIVLSELAKDRAETREERAEQERERKERRTREKREVSQYKQRSDDTSGPTTLGELSGLADLKAQIEEAEQSPSVDEAEPDAGDEAATDEAPTAEDEEVVDSKAEEAADDDAEEPEAAADEAEETADEAEAATDEADEAPDEAEATADEADEAADEAEAAADEAEEATDEAEAESEESGDAEEEGDTEEEDDDNEEDDDEDDEEEVDEDEKK